MLFNQNLVFNLSMHFKFHKIASVYYIFIDFKSTMQLMTIIMCLWQVLILVWRLTWSMLSY